MSCHNCPDRHVGCHSNCESYKADRAELDRINKIDRDYKNCRNVTGYATQHANDNLKYVSKVMKGYLI